MKKIIAMKQAPSSPTNHGVKFYAKGPLGAYGAKPKLVETEIIEKEKFRCLFNNFRKTNMWSVDVPLTKISTNCQSVNHTRKLKLWGTILDVIWIKTVLWLTTWIYQFIKVASLPNKSSQKIAGICL